MRPKTEFLFYLNKFETARLCHNGKHWILEAGDLNRTVPGWYSGYQCVARVQSRKETLLESIREHEILTDIPGRRMLAALDDDYWDFYADVAVWGTIEKLNRLHRISERTPPLPERLVVDDKVRRRGGRAGMDVAQRRDRGEGEAQHTA
jgi:hypothetical protein